MFKRKKVLSTILSAAMLASLVCSGISGAGNVNAASQSEVKEALETYKGILEGKEKKNQNTTYFCVADLDSDGMPELIYDEDGTPSSQDTFYTYSGGKAKQLTTQNMNISMYGTYKVSVKNKTFCFFRGGPATNDGIPYTYIEFEISNGAISEKNYYNATSKKNGKEWTCSDKNGTITYDEYVEKTSEFTDINMYKNNSTNREAQIDPSKFSGVAPTASSAYTWKGGNGGWWVEDATGAYPVNKWLQIDGYWYYFNASGYMAYSEWVDGYWLNGDGTCTYSGVASWKKDSVGWYYADTSGWYASGSWQKIDGNWYYFNSSGYMVTSQYIDGWWIGSDGICK